MNCRETATGKKKRITAGVTLLPIGLFMMIGGILGARAPYFGTYYLLAGLGFGGMATAWSINGLLGAPEFTLSEWGLEISGWLLGRANMRWRWDEIAHARLTTATLADEESTQVLFLINGSGATRAIEDWRYENFEQVVEFVKRKMIENHKELEIVRTDSPHKSD